MDRGYVLYGMRVLADGEIPGLTQCTYPSAADVRVWLNKMPAAIGSSERARWYQSPSLNREGRPNLIIWRTVPEGAFHFVYDDQTEFLIQPDGKAVWCMRSEAATL